MMTDDHIKDEQLQYDTNREAREISALSSCKTSKYEYLTGESILPSRYCLLLANKYCLLMIEKAKFTYSLLVKAFKEQKNLKIKDKSK